MRIRLADHRREAFDDLVAVHGKGPDAALLVARHAFLLQDRRDVVRIGDVLEVRGAVTLREGDRLADSDIKAGLLYRLAGKDGVDRVGGVGVLGRRLQVRRGLGEAVVERAMIGDPEAVLGIDDEDFGFTGDAHVFADKLQIVHQHRNAGLVLGGFRTDVGPGDGRVGVHHVEEDALVLVGVSQLLQLAGRFSRELRAGHLAHHHDRRSSLEIVELVGEAGLVGQLEVIDFRRDRNGAARRRRRGGCADLKTCDADSARQGGSHSCRH